MDDTQRLQLQNMIRTNNTEDFTQSIRELKHSQLIRNDVNNLLLIKAKYRAEPDKVHIEAASECYFLFTFYTDIYNKLRKDELNLNILIKLLDTLQKIEDGELDQHEASFKVGTLLKEMYVDSALKKADKLNEENGQTVRTEPKKAEQDISWRQFKTTHL
jgi:hypothetical protein